MTVDAVNYDVIIIGGGPAGLSAACWCSELGFRTALFDEAGSFGGQLAAIYNPIRNYLGREAANGSELAAHFEESAAQFDFERFRGISIVKADLDGCIVLTSDASYAGGSVVIATGVRRRTLGVPGEAEFQGRGILLSGTRDRDQARGQRIVVIGGGDAALENALILSDMASEVYLVHRRSQFTARDEFMDRARRRENIAWLPDQEVVEFCGTKDLDAVRLRSMTSTGERTIDVDAAVVRIGVQPNTELFRNQVTCDDKGYIVADQNCMTSVERVYAIGDVANPTSPTIASAVGQGATAAKFIVTRSLKGWPPGASPLG